MHYSTWFLPFPRSGQSTRCQSSGWPIPPVQTPTENQSRTLRTMSVLQCLYQGMSAYSRAVVKQSNSKCRVWPLLPYSNRVGLDKKLSNNPERVSINFGTWPMSNQALIAYYLISKQHFNHAKTRVQFDLTIRIVNTREGGGCLDFRL